MITLAVWERAAALELIPREVGGFCLLLPRQPGGFVARGGSWDEAFDRFLGVPEPAPFAPPAPCGDGTLFDWLE